MAIERTGIGEKGVVLGRTSCTTSGVIGQLL